MEKPGPKGFDPGRIKCKNLAWEVKGDTEAPKVGDFLLEVGGEVSMLRWRTRAGLLQPGHMPCNRF